MQNGAISTYIYLYYEFVNRTWTTETDFPMCKTELIFWYDVIINIDVHLSVELLSMTLMRILCS